MRYKGADYSAVIPVTVYKKIKDVSVAREPEPVTDNTVLQWKRQCEVEIQ